MSESFLTAVFLSLSGGLQDAYTYLFRGKVFANAQTGNIVLLSTHLFEGDWGQALHHVCNSGTMPDVFRCDRTVPDDTGSSRMYESESRLCRLYLKSSGYA